MKSKMNKFQLIAYLWMSFTSLLNPAKASRPCVVGDFQHQVETVLRHIQMTPERQRNMTHMVRDVTQTLHKRYPDWRVQRLGSSGMGIGLSWSDGDLFVFTSNNTKTDAYVDNIMAITKRQLETRPDLFDNVVTIIDKLICSRLTFIHIPTNITVDISFSSPTLVRSNAVIGQLVHLDDRFFQLATIVKYWSYVHRVVKCKKCLPSYGLYIMVVFFLQQKNMLPPVIDLQKNIEPTVLNHWNSAFENLQYQPNNNESLYELLGEFFKYYSNFDFENNVISVLCGCVIKKEQFENMQLPESLSTYTDNVKMGRAQPFPLGFINIQDVFELDVNIGRPWNPRTMLDIFYTYSKYAANAHDNTPKDKFLLTILKSHKNETRDFLTALWSEPDVAETCLAK